MTIERWQEPTITVPHHVVNFSRLGVSMDFGPTIPLAERNGIGEMLSTDNALFRLGSPMNDVTKLHSSLQKTSAQEERLALAAVMVDVAPNYDNEAFSNFGIDRVQLPRNCMTFAGEAMNAAGLILRYDRGGIPQTGGGHAGQTLRNQLSNMDVHAVYNLAEEMKDMSSTELNSFLENRFFNRYENGEHNRGLQSSAADNENVLAELISQNNINMENYNPSTQNINDDIKVGISHNSQQHRDRNISIS